MVSSLRPRQPIAAFNTGLTLAGARTAQATLGSGVVLAFDDTVDLRAILTRIAAFFRDESCGKCVPCRVGTVRQEEALRRLLAACPAKGDSPQAFTSTALGDAPEGGSPMENDAAALGDALEAREAELARLDELDFVMREASICGLGQTAGSAIASAIHRLGLFAGGTR